LPQIVAEQKALNLRPLSDSVVASAYRGVSDAELAEDEKLGRASMQAQKAEKGQP